MGAPLYAARDEDLFTAEFFDDPYPAYRAFREKDPVFQLPFNLRLEQAQEQFHDESHSWLVTGFDECAEVLRDHRRYSSAVAGVPAEEQERARLVLINTDPPRHTHMRGLLNKAFTPRRVAALEPWVRTLVSQLLDDAGDGSVDIATSVAEPLPIMVIASLIGVSREDLMTFKMWSDAMVAVPEPDTIDENRAKTQAMFDYIGAMLLDRRAALESGSDALADDFLSSLLRANDDEAPLEDWEITSFCVLLLLAGNETTRNLVSCLLNVAADRPDVWQALGEDRSSIHPAIEESLRFDSPVQILNRWATEPTVLGGHHVAVGDNVAVAYAAGNRDPRQFSDPEQFVAGRTENRHLAFGIGIHFCLGAPLARLETAVLIEEMLDRYPSISRAGPPQFQRAARVVRGLTSLPLDLGTRTRR
jgi:cytochrome P450